MKKDFLLWSCLNFTFYLVYSSKSYRKVRLSDFPSNLTRMKRCELFICLICCEFQVKKEFRWWPGKAVECFGWGRTPLPHTGGATASAQHRLARGAVGEGGPLTSRPPSPKTKRNTPQTARACQAMPLFSHMCLFKHLIKIY